MVRQARRLLAALTAAALVASLAGCGGGAKGSQAGSGGEKQPYVIGAVVSLTGPYAGLGEPEKKTIEMELAALNATGGVNGHQVKVLFEDDGTQEAKAVSAVTKLVEQDKVLAVIGATGTGQTMAMRNEIDASGVPQVSMAGGNAVTAKFDKLVFQTPWSNMLVVPFTLDYMKKQGISKVGLISDSGGFGKDGLAVINSELPKYGMTAVESQTFNPGDADMTGQLTRIKGSGAQAVLMWAAGAEAATIAKNMQQIGMTIPLFGGHGNARREFISGAGAAAEGFTFAAGKVLVPESYGAGTENYRVATDFIDRYTKAYGEAPSTFAGHAYDAFHLTIKAMESLDEGFSASELRDAIEATSGFVGIGGTFTFSPTDHNGMTAADLVMYRVTSGKWVVVQ